MTNYQAELEGVWFARLEAQVTLAPVFQHVPENTPPPVVIIGDITSENQGTKESPLMLFTVAIVTVTKGHEREPLNLLQGQIHEALFGWKPPASGGAAFGDVMLGSSSGHLIATDDGSPVYYGEQSFSQYVFDADPE